MLRAGGWGPVPSLPTLVQAKWTSGGWLAGSSPHPAAEELAPTTPHTVYNTVVPFSAQLLGSVGQAGLREN